jgi:hypothetical protein
LNSDKHLDVVPVEKGIRWCAAGEQDGGNGNG